MYRPHTLLQFLHALHAASLPIFNRGKRPRQALLTHPNNVGGASLEQQQQRQDGRWNFQTYRQAQHGDSPPRSAVVEMHAANLLRSLCGYVILLLPQ